MRVIGLDTPRTARTRRPFAHSREPRSEPEYTFFTFVISESDPTLIGVPTSATRNEIAKHVLGDEKLAEEFDFVSRDSQTASIRVHHPSVLPASVISSMRRLFEYALARDVHVTIEELRDSDPSESKLTFMTHRWASRSLYEDDSGTSYFDRFLAGLQAHTLTEEGLIWDTKKSGLEWLIDEAGSMRERVQKLIVLNSRQFRSAAGYTSHDRDPVRGRFGDPMVNRLAVVGRFYYDGGDSSVQMRAWQVLAESPSRERAVYETRNAPWPNARVVIPRPDGTYVGYGLRASIASGPLVSDPQAQAGTYRWYYPGTIAFAPGDFDPRPSTANAPDELAARRSFTLLGALHAATTSNPLPLINLDYGVLGQASLEQRIDIFRLIIGSKFRHMPLGVALLARTVDSMPASDLAAFDRVLMSKGMLDKLIGHKDGTMLALGRAYTRKATEAGMTLQPQAFANAPSLNEGKSGGFVHYWVAKVVDTKGGGREVRLEPGEYRDQWTDSARWQHDPDRGANYAPSRLVKVHKYGSKGGDRYISALEASLIAGDPESDANTSDLLDFIDLVLMIRGGLSLQAMFRKGALSQIARGATWRAGLRAAWAQGARQAALDVGEVVFFKLDRAINEHRGDLSKSAAGRTFLGLYDLAGAAFLARDLYKLGESGVLQATARAGYEAAAHLSKAAARQLRRRVDDLHAFASAVKEAIEQKLPLGQVAATTTHDAMSVAAHGNNGRKFRHILLSKQLEQTGKGLAGELTGVASKRATKATERFASAAELAAKDNPAVAKRLRRALDAARDMHPDQAKKFLKELDALLASHSDRVIGELSGFIDAAARSANPADYVKATHWLSGLNLGSSALNALGAKAAARGGSKFDLLWFKQSGLAEALSDPKLLPGNGNKTALQLLAENPGTNWGQWKQAADEAIEALASGDKVSEKTIKDLNVTLRASAGEAVTEASLPKLFSKHELSQRHKPLSVSGAKVPTPHDTAVLDFELRHLDEDVVVYLDSKAITGTSGQTMLDELKRVSYWEEATGATERLLKQIEAAWIHSGRRPPYVAIPGNLPTAVKRGLRKELARFHGTRVIEVSGGAVDELSRVIRSTLGLPARKP